MDRLLALLLVGLAEADVWADGGSWAGRLTSAVAALSVAAVAWRRAFPVVGLTVLVGALAVDAGGVGHFTDAFLPAFAAMLLLVFTVGEQGSALRAAAAATVVALGLATAQILRPDPHYTVFAQIGFFGVIGVVLPLAAGRATAIHRERTAALRRVRQEIAASRAQRLDRAAEEERLRLAAALDVFATDDLRALDRAVAAVCGGADAARVAELARTVLVRLREAIVQLHEAAVEPSRPSDILALGRRVAELGVQADSADVAPGPRPRRRRAWGGRRPGLLAVAAIYAAGVIDVVAEAGWPRPAGLLPAGLLLVIAPLPWLRRAPLTATVAVCVLLTAFAAAVTPVAPLLAGNLVLLLPYACARHGGLPGALGGAVVCGATAVAVVAVTGADLAAYDWPTSALLVLAAAGIGLIVHRESRLARELRIATAELAAEQARAEDLVRRGRRLQVARDLHDAVAHSVTVVALQAAAAARVWDGDPARAAEHLAALRATTTETLAELARLVHRLPSAAAADPGLAELDGLVGRARAAGIDVALELTGDLSSVAAEDQATAYRVVQECLTNAADHGAGFPVTVTVRAAGPAVDITVANRTPVAGGPTDPQPGRGRGLGNLAERVRTAGGVLEAGLADDGRFVVTATVGQAT